ncbi:MAG: HAD family hydrolase [Paludibacter sp.]
MKTLIIFDLDGTLLNTVADLATSTNYALAKYGFPTHETEAYRFFIGNGINNLFLKALPEGFKTPENILLIRQSFLEYYGAHNAELTVPYPGIPEVLLQLQKAGFQLAVASNKYQQATEKLVKYFFPEIEFVAVFGQREGIPVKPDATIVHDILAIAKVEKSEVIYIGDSGVDMQTAQNAGVDACGVTWGFRTRLEMEEFSPAYFVDEATEILEILEILKS